MDKRIDELLRRRDPWGYYVVPAKPGALRYLPEDLMQGLLVEEAGDVVLLRTRSRSLARRVAALLAKKGLLAEEA